MLIKKIKYTDYNGNEREEDFYFNLNKAELAEMQLSVNGGMDEYISRITNSRSTPEIAALFKELVVKSYGVKSDDGKRFIKSKEITDSFVQTEAYAELYMELATDADAAAKFINGITPSNINAKTDTAAISVVE